MREKSTTNLTAEVLGKILQYVAWVTLGFYFLKTLVQTGNLSLSGASPVQSLLAFLSIGNTLLVGILYALLLKSASLALLMLQDASDGIKVSNTLSPSSSIVVQINQFLRVFPFAMGLISLPQMFQLYLVLESFHLKTSRLVLGLLTTIFGGISLALEILF